MDLHVKKYFQQSSDETSQGHFHSVIALHDSQEMTWKEIHSLVPSINRGWYELACLNSKDRIEFSHDYWLSKLPYQPGLDEFLNRFFSSLDDIGIFLTQKKFDDVYQTHLVYSIRSNGGFFSGLPPIDEKKLSELQKHFSDCILPNDYIAFLQIHDGFCKATDCTGLTSSPNMPASYLRLQELIKQHEPILTSRGNTVDPKTLIPFYESFGMPFFQCFWAEWYPAQEMGNVYYSVEAKTISDVFSGQASSENMAFPTFIDWLIFYLERIE